MGAIDSLEARAGCDQQIMLVVDILRHCPYLGAEAPEEALGRHPHSVFGQRHLYTSYACVNRNTAYACEQHEPMLDLAEQSLC
jgi:hypothetical protein